MDQKNAQKPIKKSKEDETASPINTLSDNNQPDCSSSNKQIEFQEIEAFNYGNAMPKSQDKESQQKDKCVEWYKGNKLDSSWLLKTYDFLAKVKLGNKRSGVKCEICSKHIQEALKFSKNGKKGIGKNCRPF